VLDVRRFILLTLWSLNTSGWRQSKTESYPWRLGILSNMAVRTSDLPVLASHSSNIATRHQQYTAQVYQQFILMFRCYSEGKHENSPSCIFSACEINLSWEKNGQQWTQNMAEFPISNIMKFHDALNSGRVLLRALRYTVLSPYITWLSCIILHHYELTCAIHDLYKHLNVPSVKNKIDTMCVFF
jgi:hypothetical protein